jgi:general secretion pathway protein D
MNKKRRFMLAAVVLLAGAFSVSVASAAMSAGEIALRKTDVIRESLQKLGQPAENPVLLEAAAHAEALLEIEMERGVQETRVSILTTGRPAYESLTLGGRQRIVIDVYNTINFHSGETYTMTGPSVLKSIRTSLFQLEPQFTSRVVLDLERVVEVEIAQQGQKIEVLIPEDVAVPAAEEQTEEQEAPAIAVAEEEQESVAVEIAEIVEPEPAAEKAKAEEELELAAAEIEEQETEVEEPREAPEEEAEMADLRKQLSLQKEAYAKLQTSVDGKIEKRVAEIESKVRADLEKKERETKDALEAQTAALAKMQEKLAAESAEKPALAQQQLAGASSSETEAERSRRQLPNGVAADLMTEQRVTLNYRGTPLMAVLEALKRQAGINLLAGKEVTGTVTAMLDDVPLMKAMELVLRENGYGLVYEEGIYRVVPLDVAEAMGVTLTTDIFRLEYAKASAVATVLTNVATTKGKVVADDNSNVVIVTDEPSNMPRIADIIKEIDVPQTIVDTVTSTFRLSYLDAAPSAKLLEGMVTENGSVTAEAMTNSLILTDVPANFQVISDLIAELDERPSQVYIEVLMVDAVLSDASEFGVEWIAAAVNPGGNAEEAAFRTTLPNLIGVSEDGTILPTAPPSLDAGVMTLGILSGSVDLKAAIAAEVRSRAATILADPRILVVNNNTAKIEIVTEVPFQEITQSTQGPPVASTEFKDIGVTLEVTPRITHENTVFLRLRPEESSISGFTDTGIPISDSRRADTGILLSDGQTVVVGGLRSINTSNSVTKVPWLGDIPLLGRLFRNTVTSDTNTELLIFLTVHIVEGTPPELTPYERAKFTQMDMIPPVPDATREIQKDTMRPWGERTPFWKRRARTTR